ncbi:nucleotidyltransferase domain-containing protein [Candidatus Kaiserbacteria bacterium]|nr:nucleotidyltransferase domain-containing protein [Candidatus Kaiserbacteria bacterium]
METAQKIVDHLRGAYHPVAILLHGSRAAGKNRPHSDWDIVLLFDAEVPAKSGYEGIEGEDVDWKAVQLPLEQKNILSTFGPRLQEARVLWESGSAGSLLLEQALAEYRKGVHFDETELKSARQFFEHKISGMKDDRDTPYMFLRHLSVLYAKASNFWFNVLHNEFSKPFYVAVPTIQSKDPEYYQRLMVLCSSSYSNDEKIKAAEWINKKLFESNETA